MILKEAKVLGSDYGGELGTYAVSLNIINLAAHELEAISTMIGTEIELISRPVFKKKEKV